MTKVVSIVINERIIGGESPCYIIAEMSANHDGDINKAIDLIHAAKKAGADAIKLQTYTADTITLNCEKPDFLLPSGNAWESHKSLHALYQKAYTPWEWHKRLFEEAQSLELDIFSSPFDYSAVDLLEGLGVPAYKVASPEITDVGLLAYIAKTGKPVILSTGISNYSDIELAVDTLRINGCNDIAILKCTTAYPTPLNECNLKTIPDIAKSFNCVSGLSDHTEGNIAPMTAVALGASIIEKHFINDSQDESVDAFFSLDCDEFRAMVENVRQVEAALGRVNYQITESAQKNILAKRSLYFCQTLPKGHVITEADIRSVRPGFGAHPKYLPKYIGQVLNKSVEYGDRVTPDIILGQIEE